MKKQKFKQIIYSLAIKLVLTMLIPAVPLYAGVVNIITDSDTSVIKINKKVIGTGVVTNYHLDNGTYYVEVLENDAIIYSKLERVSNIAKTINVTSIQEPLVINKLKNSRSKAGHIFSQKSNFGLGLHLDYSGVNAGLNISYSFLGLEHQFIGFAYETDEEKSNNFTYRVLKYFPGQLKEYSYFRPYAGIGYGTTNISDNTYKTKRILSEAIIGIQFGFLKNNNVFKITPIDAAIGLVCPPLFLLKKASYFLGSDDNLLYYIETGYTHRQTTTNDPDEWGTYKGLKLSVGTIYKF
jgi:hypothetical protein